MKLTIGLSNLTIFPITTAGTTSQKPTYGGPIKLGGAQTLTLSPNSNEVSSFADNIKIAADSTITSLSGSITVANVEINALKALFDTKTLNTAGTIIKFGGGAKECALSLEVLDKDNKKVRYQFFRVKLSLPELTFNTKGDNTEYSSYTLTIEALARENDNQAYVFQSEPSSSATSAVSNQWAKFLTGLVD